MSTDAISVADEDSDRRPESRPASKPRSRSVPAYRMGEALAIESKTMDPEHPLHATVAAERVIAEVSKRDGQVPPPPRDRRTVGLALSGGGIRSATFGLGVLQALAAARRLGSFDYLSSVSGGGYIACWLSAWIHRSGLRRVQEELGQCGSLDDKGSPTSAEPSEVTWLRRYSNYLSPRVGLLSFDSLTLIATWMRNVALNAVILLGFLSAVMVIPFLLIQLVRLGGFNYISSGFAAAWCGFVFLGMAGYNLWQQSMPAQRRRNWIISTPGVVSTVILPGALACCCASIWLVNGAGGPPTSDTMIYAGVLVGCLMILVFVGWAIAELLKPPESRLRFGDFVIMAFAGVVAFAAGFLMFALLYRGWDALSKSATLIEAQILLLLIGPPALAFAFGVTTTVFTGMVGRAYFERSREWWSRLNAWLLALGIGWALWIALAFLSLPLLVWMKSQVGNWMALIGTGWIGSLLTAVLFRKPQAASKRVAMKVDSVLNAAAAIFIVGLMVVLSAGIGSALLLLSKAPADLSDVSVADEQIAYEVHDPRTELSYTVATPPDPGLPLLEVIQAYLRAFQQIDNSAAWGSALTIPAAVVLGLIGLVILFSIRVDVNKFSLHNMYKNRLVRCYLGASNQFARNEQPFTGLDEADDFPLAKLGGSLDSEGKTQTPAQRPMHIINAALNLTQGANLAWQERKAASFVFTPVICGFSLERTQGDSTSVDEPSSEGQSGYRLTVEYGGKEDDAEGFSLGMALATSGAALSPNMGYASRPVRAFLLTLFNVRLGRWSANPSGTAWKKPSPGFGLVPLLQELFGYSNERRRFVYLSDGGHFDNLGIYELVRRRCATIFAIDAGTDPERKMGDLAATVRKCRVDLGVEIDLPELALLEGDSSNEALQGFMRGVIRYDISDRSKDGTLILIKPSMSRDRGEPLDVLNYANRNPPFPQQTTSDQFFDESQFESYRRLGVHITERALTEYGFELPDPPAFLEPAPVSSATETPALSTRLIAFLKGYYRMKVPPPLRDGALIDMHLGLGILVLAAIVAFVVCDHYLLGVQGSICITRAGCEVSLQELFKASASSPLWFMIRAWADNLFVILYSAFFISGFIAVLRDKPSTRIPLAALLVLVLSTATADMLENIRMMSSLQTVNPSPEQHLASITQAKFILGGVMLLAWLAMCIPIVRKFRARWP